MKTAASVLLLLLLVSVLALATTNIRNLADITGDGANHTIASTSGFGGTWPTQARWIQFQTPSGNSATAVRWGDCSTLGATRGGQLVAGSGQFLPPIPSSGSNNLTYYDLTQVCYRIASMDTLTITWSE